MATGHWNPGYGDIISRNRRVKSALPHGQMAGALPSVTMLDSATLEDIKEHAKDLWLQPDRAQTSYNDHFKERVLDISDITTSRPTSAGRKHKPHPPDVFLTTHLHTVPGYGRLHEIPGYHNPDTTLGKGAYKSDGDGLSIYEQQRRKGLREKYIGRPSTAIVNQYKTSPQLEMIKDPIERQGFEAWLKLASKDDQQNFLSSLQTCNDNDNPMYRTSDPTYRPKTAPSLHRYLKYAGAAEKTNVENLRNLYKYPKSDGHISYGNDLFSRKIRDIEKTKNVTYKGSTKRGDFLMHPEWTPSMTHHRLNGLSSVDLPYFPGRR